VARQSPDGEDVLASPERQARVGVTLMVQRRSLGSCHPVHRVPCTCTVTPSHTIPRTCGA